MFRVNEGEKPKSSSITNEKILIKRDQIPTVSAGNIRRIKGKRMIPDPICKKVDK